MFVAKSSFNEPEYYRLTAKVTDVWETRSIAQQGSQVRLQYNIRSKIVRFYIFDI